MIYYDTNRIQNWLYFPRTAYAPVTAQPRVTLYLRNTSTQVQYSLKTTLTYSADYWAFPVFRTGWADIPEGQYTYRLAPSGYSEEIGLLQVGAPANTVTEYNGNITFKEYGN